MDLSISSIVEDDNGNLWISSSKGIWQYIRQEKRFVNYMNGDGLFTHQYDVCAGFLTPDDRIVFAQKDGITVFKPSEIRSKDNKKLTAHLTRFLREGRPIDFRNDHFVIPYDENSFAMEFSLLDYENTENISYQYRLNDGPWVSTVRGNNLISFGKMKPGTYYIHVRAEDNGNVSPEELRLTVIVNNPWYLTTWALCAYFLIAALIGWYLFRNYNKRKA